MPRTLFRPSGYGSWALIVASLIGLALAVFNYLNRGDGIAYSPGALLVLVSTVLILAASIVVLIDLGLPAWLGGVLYGLIILGLIGTGLAAWFLDSYWLTALMIVGLIGCLFQLLIGTGDTAITHRASGAGRLS